MVGEVIGRHSQSPDEQACTLQRCAMPSSAHPQQRKNWHPLLSS
eukprot:COSAG03_NODE_23444_length_280_cov_0.569061_2_plen_43_part_01